MRTFYASGSVTTGRTTRRSRYLFDLPASMQFNHERLASLSGWAENMANTFDARGERKFPIDIPDVLGPLTTFNEYRVTLPRGGRRASRRTSR